MFWEKKSLHDIKEDLELKALETFAVFENGQVNDSSLIQIV